jgi:hypothetical protein
MTFKDIASPDPLDNLIPPPPAAVFAARVEAIAYLWAAGEHGDDERSLQRAVDCAFAATPSGMGIDAAQLIMARAFSRVRDDLGWVVP